jgi:ActR/RegA family two-component response regulator
MNPRLLFVDDEENIRTLLPVILRQQGFDVTVAASVPEALDFITRQKFDILLSDLNIGQPGDGFTVVSAMRRTQPDVATFILTGYPDFQTALEAIRLQVDDYLTKPADIGKMVETLKAKLAQPRKIRKQGAKRVSTVIEDNSDRILESWLAEVKINEELQSLHLSDRQRVDHLPWVLKSLIRTLEADQVEVAGDALDAARKHAADRAKQGYSIPMLVLEAGILHRVLSRVLEECLLEIDVSTLVSDAMKIGENLNAMLEQSIRAFQKHQVHHAA